MNYTYDYSVLVVAEMDFGLKGKDTPAYMEKLQSFLTKRAGDSNLRMMTVSGRYMVDGIEALVADDRNKTSFIKSLEDHLPHYDEIIVIANFEKDPFIDALGTRAGELSKTFTIYKYETRKHEES